MIDNCIAHEDKPPKIALTLKGIGHKTTGECAECARVLRTGAARKRRSCSQAFVALVGFGLTLGRLIENTEGFMTIVRMIEFPMFCLSGALLPITVIKGMPLTASVRQPADARRRHVARVSDWEVWHGVTVIVVFALLFLFPSACTFFRTEVN